MTAAPHISVVIPATSNPVLLEYCLASLDKHAELEGRAETIVVLNGAEDRVAAVAREHPRALVVESKTNRGTAGGLNLGAEAARGEHLVLLHDDAEVTPGWLDALVDAAEARPDAAAVGSRLVFPDGRLQAIGAVLWSDATTTSVEDEDAQVESGERRAVDYCGSASLLLRRSCWEAVGGFNEGLYPAYYVDVDLAMMLRTLGRVVIVEPRSVAIHHRGATLDQDLNAFASERNRERFRARWAAELADHEPAGERSSADVARALRKAAGRGPRAAVPAAGHDPGRRLSDESDFLRLEAELLGGYARRLRERASADRQALEGVEAERLRLRARAESLEARLKRIEAHPAVRIARRARVLARRLR